MNEPDCSGPLARWTASAPGPWAAVVWAPFLLWGPVADLWPGPLAWAALTAIAGFFVLAVVAAGRPDRRRAHVPDVLLALQAVASAVVLPALPPDDRLWIVILLSIGLGAAADVRAGMWLVVFLSVYAAVGRGVAGGFGEALSVGFPVLVSGVGTFSFYRLYDVIAELKRTREELARLAVHAERLRVARDLHDVLGHSLSVMVVKAEAVRRLAPRDLDAALVHAGDIELIGRQALGDVRRTVAGYRGDGARREIDRAREALSAADIRLTVVIDPDTSVRVLDDPVLGWATRESVTNVIRHAHARSCRISLRTGEDETVLVVADDGRGMVGARRQATRGQGLTGLDERVSEAGGVLEVRPSDGGRGTEVVVRLPTPPGGRGPAVPEHLLPTGSPRDAPQDALR